MSVRAAGWIWGVRWGTDADREGEEGELGKQGLSDRGAFGDDIIRKQSSCALSSLWVTVGDSQI